MKICIDCRMINHSGIGTYLVNVVNGLLKSRNYDISLLGSKEVLIQYFRDSNFKAIEFNVPIYSIKEQILLPFYVPKCDIFWSPHYNVPIFPVSASKKIVTIHDVYHLAFYKEISFVQVIYSRLLLNYAAFFSYEIITVSEFSKSEILRFLGNKFERKISVIYNGVDSCDETIQKKSSEGRKYILFVGNIKPHKNLKNVLLAFEKIAMEYPEIDLYLVGKKEGFINGVENSLSSILDKIGSRIIFTGWVSEEVLIEYYKKALAFIFPSTYEGFGLPPLEAMAFGCPTLVSNIPSLKEVCGDSSLFFEPHDINDIAKSIKLVIDSDELRINLIKKGFNRVKSFSWSNSIHSHTKLFSDIKYLYNAITF